MTTEPTSVLLESRDGIAIATINRPDRKNAIDFATYKGLIAAIQQVEGDASARALVLTGAGGNFTSGNDLADFARNPASAHVAIEFLQTLSTAQKPMLAAVEGFAVGIGSTMLLHCDFCYAASSARFRMPFVNLGLTPEGGSSLLLPRIAGHKRAAELLMLGEEFTADVASAAGFVTQVVEADSALATALATAEKLARLPAGGLKLTKKLLRAEYADALQRVIVEEAKVFGQRLTSAEAQAAFARFFAGKR